MPIKLLRLHRPHIFKKTGKKFMDIMPPAKQAEVAPGKKIEVKDHKSKADVLNHKKGGQS